MEPTAATALKKVEEIKAIEPATLNEIAGSYTAPAKATPNVTGSEAEAKAFIYAHESSNRLDAMNAGGCKGLGQDCNGVLEKDCPSWRTDYACQDAFWERYMAKRYGTWAKAKAHWQARVPINGKDVGNWW